MQYEAIKILKNQHMITLTKDVQEQMQNKVTVMYHSGKGYKAIFEALGL